MDRLPAARWGRTKSGEASVFAANIHAITMDRLREGPNSCEFSEGVSLRDLVPPPPADRWRAMASMPKPRIGLDLCRLGSQVGSFPTGGGVGAACSAAVRYKQSL